LSELGVCARVEAVFGMNVVLYKSDLMPLKQLKSDREAPSFKTIRPCRELASKLLAN
jgi:hypothetical protein